MGSDRFRRSEGDSRFEWVLTGSGFPRFANRFRELVPGFDRFRGSESGNAVRRGRVKHPCCWGYHLRFFFFVFLLRHDDKDYNNMAFRCAVYLMAKLEIPGLPVDFATTSKKSAQRPKGPPAKALGIL